MKLEAKQRLQAAELRVFKNKHFTKRDPETTNVVAVEAEEPPDDKNWVETDPSILKLPGIMQLWLKTENGKNYRYFGYM